MVCRTFPILLLVGGGLSALSGVVADESTKPQKFWVYIGTYTGKESKGIYRCELDLASGQLSQPMLAGEAANPSFLAIHPNRRFLYAVGEIDNFGGKKAGGVSSFALDPKTGSLALLNSQSSGGAGPCHVIVDKAGKNVLAANYGGGSACVLPIQTDGKLGEATAIIQHKGSSVNKQRQEAPHAHSINLDPANRFAFVADLGLDRILIYQFDASKGTLDGKENLEAAVAPGSGPRHFAFHPDGKHAYVINEMACTITVFDYDSARGSLKAGQTITTLPKDAHGDNYSTAEVQVHPSGRFVYGSNRGHNSIAVFAVNPTTGELSAVGHQGHGIKTPRNFGIDPTGTFLIVANQDGDSLIVFRIDPKTGELTPTGSTVNCPMPVCVKFMVPGT